MKEKTGPDLVSQMKQARDLLEEGEVRDALVLAMDVLWRELEELRNTLGAIQETLPPEDESRVEGKQELSSEQFFIWPEPLSHLFH